MTDWPHAPCHRFNAAGTYIVTAATLNKKHYFHTNEHLDFLQASLFELALKYDWQLKAWAIFPNHYHFIAQSSSNPSSLIKLLIHLHAHTARKLNRIDNTPGRKVWCEYWDTQLTFEKSYLARLNYVMNNPVKHKIVTNAEDYRWCSVNWFNQHSTMAYRKTVANFKTDKIAIIDDF